MSVKEKVVPEKSQILKRDVSNKRRRLNSCFSFTEISMEPGTSLKDVDSNKFKAEIKRWAKAVVAYARQVSGRLGSSRRTNGIGSSLQRIGSGIGSSPQRGSTNGIGSPESSSRD